MGLINNWLHKKDKKQLEQHAEKKTPSVVVATPTAKGRASDKNVGEKKSSTHTEHKHKDTEEKTKTKSKVAVVKVAADSTAFKVLIKPLVTEKSAIAESKNKYSFVVANNANKEQVKTAVTEIYGVKPIRVNMANIEGRAVRFGRAMGRRRDYKKAIVTLPEGKTIDIHAGV